MSYLADRITVDPGQCGGRPCVRGMRIRVSDVIDLYAAGLESREILDEIDTGDDFSDDDALISHDLLAFDAWGGSKY